MCPDPQILSIYLDGELPSPWKEKMQEHFTQCSACRGKLENFKRLQDLLKEDKAATRTYIERVVDEPSEPRTYTEDELQKSKEKVWERIEAGQGFNRRSNRSRIWQRKISIPLPAAAVAAVLVLLFAVFWLNGRSATPNNQTPSVAEIQRGNVPPSLPIERANYVLAAEMGRIEDGLIPAAEDMSGILQYLAPQNTGANIIILQLPESKNFSRSGEPAIIRAADFSERQQQRNRRQR
ncbi:MAG: zf-HC2 domain-containing protein [Treponema sp.]|nr:zf-HC2 domain-containing protein [Treponema sp.]